MMKTLFPIPKDLFTAIRAANSEATVRQLVIQQLDCEDIKLEEDRSDASHENILFEFKYDEDMKSPSGRRAEILAQALYYCNFKYKDGKKRVPPYVALIDKDEFVIYEREKLEPIYKNLPLFNVGTPSNPQEEVVELAKKVEPNIYIFTYTPEDLNKAINELRRIISSDALTPEDITEYNVLTLYSGWQDCFVKFLNQKGRDNKPHVFRQDCSDEGEIIKIDSGDVFGSEVITIKFNINNEIVLIERCPKSLYTEFLGKKWKRITDPQEEKIIFQTIADLFDIQTRRTKGQFYTPTELAQHGWDYLEKEIGENFWYDGTWRIWDCSCGEGGLAINVIPRSALQYTYLSSLDIGEIDFVKKHLPMCKKVWQMDFLNTQLHNFPEEIRQEMNNPDIKWLFFINPPYGEGSSGKATANSEWYKKGVSLSLVREQMINHNMSVASKEKYAQFLFRIEKEFRGKYVLGSYTTMKIFVSKEYANLRKFWRPVFKSGLICCANKWHQGNGAFPSVFSVFDCREKGKWGRMEYDILEYQKGHSKGVFKGKKSFMQEDITRSFRKYFFQNEGLPCDELSIVQSNGLKSFAGKEPVNNYRSRGAFATARFISSYMRMLNFTWMVSGITVTHPMPINKNNYKKVLCGLGLYWSIKPTWQNNGDFLSAPVRDLTPQEETDSVLYALVSTRNRTTTARLDYAPQGITVGKKKNVPNGGIVENKLNPFDEKLFDWSDCSDIGKETLRLYKHYLDNIVKWKEQDTVLGKGEWLGMYQYHRIKKIPQELVDAIEKLRQSVEKTALELCF